MRKYIVFWSFLVLTICGLRIITPATILNFAGLSFPFAVYGSIVSMVALIFTSSLWDRIDFRQLFGLGAIFSLVFFIFCLYSPTFADMRQTYISALDIFIALESSIILAAASLEKKEDALPIFTAFALLVHIFSSKIHAARTSTHTLGKPRYSS